LNFSTPGGGIDVTYPVHAGLLQIAGSDHHGLMQDATTTYFISSLCCLALSASLSASIDAARREWISLRRDRHLSRHLRNAMRES